MHFLRTVMTPSELRRLCPMSESLIKRSLSQALCWEQGPPTGTALPQRRPSRTFWGAGERRSQPCRRGRATADTRTTFPEPGVGRAPGTPKGGDRTAGWRTRSVEMSGEPLGQDAPSMGDGKGRVLDHGVALPLRPRRSLHRHCVGTMRSHVTCSFPVQMSCPS